MKNYNELTLLITWKGGNFCELVEENIDVYHGFCPLGEV